MVRNEIAEKVGQRVNVEAQVSIPWDGKRVAWCIFRIQVDGIPMDHSWIQFRDNPELSKISQNIDTALTK